MRSSIGFVATEDRSSNELPEYHRLQSTIVRCQSSHAVLTTCLTRGPQHMPSATAVDSHIISILRKRKLYAQCRQQQNALKNSPP